MADWQEDSNADCRENDANELCATCGKTWANHIGRCCDGDESSPRRFKLAEPVDARDLIEVLCSSAVAFGEDGSEQNAQSYYAAKAHLIGAVAHRVPGAFLCRKPAIGPACEMQCEKCAADAAGAGEVPRG